MIGYQGLTCKRRRIPALKLVTSGNTGGSSWIASFSPNGNFIAVNGDASTKEMSIWSWDGVDTVAEVESLNLDASTSNNSWHPDGDFIASSFYSSATGIRVYSWNGTDTLAEVETAAMNATERLQWHPDGDYLAVAADRVGSEIIVYSWNGTTTLAEVETVNIPQDYGFNVRWSDNGDYLATCNYYAAGESSEVYSWNGTDTLAQIDGYDNNTYTTMSVWSSDNSYLFNTLGYSDSKSLEVLAFNGTALSFKDNVDLGAAAVALDIYDDKYIAVSVAKTLYLYEFDSVAEDLTFLSSIESSSSTSVFTPTFSSDGAFISLGVVGESGKTFKVYSTNI